MCEKTSGISVEMLTSDSSTSVTSWNTLNAKIPVKLEDVTSATRSSHGQERIRPVTPPYAMSREFDDGEEMDWKALYLREAEKNKQLLQWIIQLQSTLNHGLQMIEPSKNKNNNPEVQSNKCPKIAGIASLLDGSSDFRDGESAACSLDVEGDLAALSPEASNEGRGGRGGVKGRERAAVQLCAFTRARRGHARDDGIRWSEGGRKGIKSGKRRGQGAEALGGEE